VTDGAVIRFEDRLLAELMPLVGSVRPGDAPVPLRSRPEPLLRLSGYRLAPPRRRIAALLGVLLLVLAGLGVGVALWPRRLATPAYAVEDQSDGSVLVTVNDLSDPAGLQSALAAHHVRAAVLVIAPGAPPCTEPMSSVAAPGAIQGRPDHPNVLAIRPDLLPPGTTAVLGLVRVGPGAAGGGDQFVTLSTVVRGPAPRCFPGAVPDPGPH